MEFKVATRSQENILRSLWLPWSLLILVSSNGQNISFIVSDLSRFPPRDRKHFFELGVPDFMDMLRNYYKEESWTRFVDLSFSTFILDLLLELNHVSCVCYIKTEKKCRD